MATRSFIARPTDAGYAGVYFHADGDPRARLPLLLACYRYGFYGDIEAMARHLIDDLPGSARDWGNLGTDLLHGAPEELRHTLTGGHEYPSRTLANLTDMSGAPAARRLITQSTSGGLDWGYVLHPHGIEVISLPDADRGPIVEWHTDPATPFSNNGQRWKPDRRPPIRARPPLPAPSTPARTRATAPQRTARQ